MLLVTVACSGGDGSSAPSRSTGGGTSTEATVAEKLPAELPDVARIELTTATSGVGARPTLRWKPVAGAARYVATVFAADGHAYWSWTGSATSVPLGGGDRPPAAGQEGPTLADGMTWVVGAFDARGRTLGLSGRRPISP